MTARIRTALANAGAGLAVAAPIPVGARAEPEPGPVFTDVGRPRGPLTRTRWELESEGTRGWVTEAADDPSGPWRVTSSVRLLEPLVHPFRP